MNEKLNMPTYTKESLQESGNRLYNKAEEVATNKYVLALVEENGQIIAKIFNNLDCAELPNLVEILRIDATIFDYKLVQHTLIAIK